MIERDVSMVSEAAVEAPANAQRVAARGLLAERGAAIRESPFTRVWVITVVLFAVSAVLVPGTLASSALLSMIPFAAILALAAAGQTLVVQQGGIDLACGAVMSMAAAVLVVHGNGTNDGLLWGMTMALGLSLLAGVVVGLAVTWVRITPLIATIAMGAVITGMVLRITGGNVAAVAPPALTEAVSQKFLSIQLVTWIAVVVIAVLTFIGRKSVVGRRMEFVGANPVAAKAMGWRVARYQVAAYALAGLIYGTAGIVLAGFVARTDLATGDEYILLTIAAVAIGGTSLGGGKASLIATAVGAVFLIQLGQIVRAAGAPAAVQFLVQGLVLVLGIGLRRGDLKRMTARLMPVGSGRPKSAARH